MSSSDHLSVQGGTLAELTGMGHVRANCSYCKGALTTFEWNAGGNAFGVIQGPPFKTDPRGSYHERYEWRLMRCAGCGRGGMAMVRMGASDSYGNGGGAVRLIEFHPEAGRTLPLPKDVPEGICREFREAERCLDAKCWRAAAGMFRSVLDKTLRANGYKLKQGTTLEQQIDLAASDGVITAARQKRAHEDIRVLGNDVLHDEWQEIRPEDVEPAHQYAQRVLEDFYDDRATTLEVLKAKGRTTATVPDAAPSISTVAAGPPRVARSAAPKPLDPLE